MNNEFKACRICKHSKKLSDFHKNANADGRFNTCKKCQYARLKVYRANPTNKQRFKEYAKNNDLGKRYNISLAQYNQMVINQSNKCLICDNEPNKKGSKQTQILHVDHCHVTDKVRGLLCHLCNRGIGLFRERIDLIQKAAEYLKNNS